MSHRTLRDVVHYHAYEAEDAPARALREGDESVRLDFLNRFAEREGIGFLRTFWHKYRDVPLDERIEVLADSVPARPAPLAAAFLTVRPHSDLTTFVAFMRQLGKAGTLEAAHVQTWYEIRNSVMHGNLVEPWSSEEGDARLHQMLDLLHALTRARIAAGIGRYWRPFTLEAAGHTFERRPGVRTRDVMDVMTTLHTTASNALAVPVEGRDGKTATPLSGPLRTMTTRNETGILTPFIAELRGGGSDARTVGEPFATFAASGTHHGLVVRGYGTNASEPGWLSTPTTEPIRTLTAAGSQFLVTHDEDVRQLLQ